MENTRSRNILSCLLAIFFCLALASCGGSGNSGAGNTRNLTGSLGSVDNIPSSSSSTAMMSFSHPSVSLDGITVIATATDGTTVTTQADSSGNFTLPLVIGQSYVVSFAQNNVFLGTLIVSLDSAGNFSSRGFTVTNGDGDIALGKVVCSAGVCTAEINPNCELDDDEDGVMNCDDHDFMDRHPDFDHDGIGDDEEGDEHHHHSEGDECEVTAIDPFNGELGVALNEKIELHFASAVDVTTVTPTSLSLTDSTGALIATTIVVDQSEDEKEGVQIALIPTSPLAPLTSYTVHLLSTVQCLNGSSPLADMEIQFTTGTTSE